MLNRTFIKKMRGNIIPLHMICTLLSITYIPYLWLYESTQATTLFAFNVIISGINYLIKPTRKDHSQRDAHSQVSLSFMLCSSLGLYFLWHQKMSTGFAFALSVLLLGLKYLVNYWGVFFDLKEWKAPVDFLESFKTMTFVNTINNSTNDSNSPFSKLNSDQEIIDGQIPFPSFVLFYRGEWCPYCSGQISELNALSDEFSEHGLRMILVSTDSPDVMKKMSLKFPGRFILFSDPKAQAAKKLGLKNDFSVPLPLQGLNRGADSFYPTLVLLGMDGEVVKVYNTDNITNRPNPRQVLADFAIYQYRQHLEKTVDERTNDVRRLLRVVIHDVANPLTIIQATHQSVTKKFSEISVDQQKLWSRIARASNTIESIIKTTRELEAVRSGVQTLELKNLNVYDLCQNLQDLFAERLKAKNISLKIDSRLESEKLQIQANENVFLHSVLSNIISNAIKFSPESSDLEILVNKIDSDVIDLCIKDHGVGIPKELLIEFTNGNNLKSRVGTQGEKGTGFGLDIARSYVRAMGGQLSVISRTQDEAPQNSGTEVYIEMKRAS